MKKNDTYSLIISLGINILIILSLTVFANPEVAGKLKVGLVSTGENDVSYKGNKDKEGAVPDTPPVPTPPEEKKVEEKNIPSPDNNEVVAQVQPQEPSIDDMLKEVQIKAPPTKSDKGIKAPNISTPKPRPQSSSSANQDVMEANIETKGSKPGIPSGYKLGAVDGDIIANWSPTNRDPEYPESAQLQGLNGTVSLRLTIDEYGNVRNVDFVKSSGVPAIDLAIEKVARTWKINLKKKNKIVSGDVILDYKFKLGAN